MEVLDSSYASFISDSFQWLSKFTFLGNWVILTGTSILLYLTYSSFFFLICLELKKKNHSVRYSHHAASHTAVRGEGGQWEEKQDISASRHATLKHWGCFSQFQCYYFLKRINSVFSCSLSFSGAAALPCWMPTVKSASVPHAQYGVYVQIWSWKGGEKCNEV